MYGQIWPLWQGLAWWGVTVLRIKPVAWSSLLARSGCGWKEVQCQAHYWTVPTRFWHISRPSGWQASHQVLLIFLFSMTVGVRINDSDFDAYFVNLSQSCAAFHRIGRTCFKPPCSSLWFRNFMKQSCMDVQLKGQFEMVKFMNRQSETKLRFHSYASGSMRLNGRSLIWILMSAC